MFGNRKFLILAAASAVGGLLSVSPAGAQALRLGLMDKNLQTGTVAPTDVAWRGGGGGFRGGGFRGGGFRGGGFRGARMGGFRGPARVGGFRPGIGRPVAWNRPGWNRPGWNRPVGPGWNRPGWNRPGWGPGWNRPGWNRPGWGPGWGWNRPAWGWGPGWNTGWGPGWGYYDNTGAWIAGAAATGLAVGAIAAANSEPVYGSDAVAYCMQRFRSYDPRTGTYLGYDGLRHPCP